MAPNRLYCTVIQDITRKIGTDHRRLLNVLNAELSCEWKLTVLVSLITTFWQTSFCTQTFVTSLLFIFSTLYCLHISSDVHSTGLTTIRQSASSTGSSIVDFNCCLVLLLHSLPFNLLRDFSFKHFCCSRRNSITSGLCINAWNFKWFIHFRAWSDY